MDFLQALILGIIQGITEWLPVSSSAQITLVGSLSQMSYQEAFSFGIFLHFGTLLAVLFKFRDIRLYLNKFIIIATVFTGIIGIPLYIFMSYSGEFISIIIGVSLILTGIILRISKNKFGTKRSDEGTLKDSSIIGFFQGFSVLPGISRSGITISSLLFRGFRQEEALKMSFLLSVPAVFGAILLDIAKNSEILVLHYKYIIVGIVFAFLSGYLVMDFLLRVAKKIRFEIFCIVFGVITLVMLW